MEIRAPDRYIKHLERCSKTLHVVVSTVAGSNASLFNSRKGVPRIESRRDIHLRVEHIDPGVARGPRTRSKGAPFQIYGAILRVEFHRTKSKWTLLQLDLSKLRENCRPNRVLSPFSNTGRRVIQLTRANRRTS